MEYTDSKDKYYKDIQKRMKVFDRYIDSSIDKTSKFLDDLKSRVLTISTNNGTYSLYMLCSFANSFVLLNDGGTLKNKTKVCGCMHGSISDKVFTLENIAIKKKDQGQGLGQKLIEFSKDWAKQSNCDTMQLEADQNYVYINGKYIHLDAYIYFVKHNMEFKFDSVDDILAYVYTERIPFKYNLNDPTPYKDKVFGKTLQTKDDFEAYNLRNLIHLNATKMHR